MYELVSVTFPFADQTNKGKLRPGFVISPSFGKYNQVIVAYVTTKLDEQLETDILLNPSDSDFPKTGLKEKSLIKLHRLGTFQPTALKEGQGFLSHKLITQLKKKLMEVFQL